MKTALVTGATDGIGRETARQLLAKGLRVFIHGRTLGKAGGVVDELKRAHPEAQAEAVYADLANMHEVLGLAEQIRKKAKVLDICINNAGVYEDRRILTQDGFELTMAVNHFAHFLLTHQLLPLLKSAPQGRMLAVRSPACRGIRPARRGLCRQACKRLAFPSTKPIVTPD